MNKKKGCMDAITDTKEYYKAGLESEQEEHEYTRQALTIAEKQIAGYGTLLQSANTDAENLLAYSKDLEERVEALKEFACTVIREECWGIAMDGMEIQDLAEKLGLIAEHIATEEDIGEEDDFEVGDKIYKFTKLTQAERQV